MIADIHFLKKQKKKKRMKKTARNRKLNIKERTIPV